VGTVTQALKCRKLLSKSSIQSKLIKIDSSNEKSGCTYGIEISKANFYSAVIILRQNRIDYSLYNG